MEHRSRNHHAAEDDGRNARLIAALVIILPAAGTAVALTRAALGDFRLWYLWMFLGMYALTLFGVEGGFHRLFAHRAYKTGKFMKGLLIILGSMAAQGPVIWFAAVHRTHHASSDEPDDPHSPYIRGNRKLGGLRGLWHSHLGWMLEHDVRTAADWVRLVPDLARDAFVFRMHLLYPVWVLLGLLLPAALGALLGGLEGALGGFLWGGMVRLFAVHHIMWSIGSLCHISGSRPFDTGDQSRNNALIGLLSFGVGWHNNHHAFQSSARIGLRWWQIDINYYLIRALEIVGLAREVKRPAPEVIRARGSMA